MRIAARIRQTLLPLLMAPLLAVAAEFDNPLAAIAANPRLSELYGLLKKTGYVEPLGTGGDITFLALSNKLLSETKAGERFSTLDLFRDKIPPEALLQILQSLTLDGQYTQAEFDELLVTQGSGTAIVASVLGKGVQFRLHRGKETGNYVLEDARHNGLSINVANEIVTENGAVIVVDAAAVVPK